MIAFPKVLLYHKLDGQAPVWFWAYVCVWGRCWSSTCHEWLGLCCSLECLFDTKVGIDGVVLQLFFAAGRISNINWVQLAVLHVYFPGSAEKVKSVVERCEKRKKHFNRLCLVCLFLMYIDCAFASTFHPLKFLFLYTRFSFSMWNINRALPQW